LVNRKGTWAPCMSWFPFSPMSTRRFAVSHLPSTGVCVECDVAVSDVVGLSAGGGEVADVRPSGSGVVDWQAPMRAVAAKHTATRPVRDVADHDDEDPLLFIPLG